MRTVTRGNLVRNVLLLPVAVGLAIPVWLWVRGSEVLQRLRYADEVQASRSWTDPTTRWLPFMYCNYYDFPRSIVIEAGGRVLLLDCPFRDDLDDYSPTFEVYRLSRSPGWPSKRWANLVREGVRVGEIATRDVQFDDTHRHRLLAPKLAAFLT